MMPHGSIEKRGPNTWRVIIPMPGGKLARRTVHFPSDMPSDRQREECEIELDRLRVEIHDQRYRPEIHQTFTEFANVFLTEHARPNLKPNTVAFYEDMLKRILPAIGEYELSELSPLILTGYINSLRKEISPKTKKALSDSTRRHIYDAIKIILDKAVFWEIMDANPMDHVLRPSVKRRRRKGFTKEQARKLIEDLQHDADPFQAVAILLALIGGLRLGEVAGLLWSDIDFKEGTIAVGRSRNYLPALGIYVDDPKSEDSIRTITVPAKMIELLKRVKSEQGLRAYLMGARWQGDGHVVTNWDGKPVHPDTPSKWWRKFRVKHDLPDVRFHDLRHAHASLMYSLIDVVTLAARLGHADPNTTLRMYGGSTIERDKEASDKLGDLIF